MAFFYLCSNAHTRLTPETHNYVTVHGDLGASVLLHNIPNQKPGAGMNGIIGVDYRLYHNNFLFTIGAEGMYNLFVNPLDNVHDTLMMNDTEAQLFGMNVLVKSSRDRAHMVNVNVPVLVGGEWGNFYFLVGPKLSLNLYGATSSSALATTYGDYDRYYDDFYDMPNHQFETNKPLESGMIAMKWNMNVLAHVEIGGLFQTVKKHRGYTRYAEKVRTYLSVYADFGVLNLRSSQGGNPIFGNRETDQGEVQFYVEPLLTSDLSDGKIFRSLSIGVRYTVSIPMPERGKSYKYNHKRSSVLNRKRRGTQAYY